MIATRVPASPSWSTRRDGCTGRFLLEVRFENHETEWALQIERIRALEPDSLVLWGRAESSGRVLAGLRAAGIGVPVYGPDRLADTAFLGAAGAAAEGVTLTYPLDPSQLGERWLAFRSTIRAGSWQPSR